MQRRRFLAAAAAALSAPLVAGCAGGSGGGSQVAETTEVAMAASQFDPRNIHVEAGATVTWTNEDSVGHTVTNASDNWTFDQAVDGGGTAAFTFDAAGVYDVYCRYHGTADPLEGMSMKVAVGDATIQEPLGGSTGGSSGAYG